MERRIRNKERGQEKSTFGVPSRVRGRKWKSDLKSLSEKSRFIPKQALHAESGVFSVENDAFKGRLSVNDGRVVEEKARDRQQKERITKDVRYQEPGEVTFGWEFTTRNQRSLLFLSDVDIGNRRFVRQGKPCPFFVAFLMPPSVEKGFLFLYRISL
ncbi:MAG: hypothetical protein IKC31_04420 [Clostridia bacterium]|nr:hypothetical protein [Clostridia bacterium]